MEGILIVSADNAVSQSLKAIVGEGKTVYECCGISDALALASAHRMDYLFVDDVFRDGTGRELVARLHQLGYGRGIIPILVSTDPLHLEPYRQFGIRACISKPFDVQEVERSLEQLREAADGAVSPPSLRLDDSQPSAPLAARSVRPEPRDLALDMDIREVSQRFRRLLERSLKREDLIASFSEGMQEQFDIDNVVVLLPENDSVCYRIVAGNVPEEVRGQFFLPFGDPLLAALIRFAEPVWLPTCEQLDAQQSATAVRCGERLGVQLLCPVLSGGKLLALVGLSRIHRYGHSPSLVSFLRLFLTFFAKALENAGLYDEVSSAEQTFRGVFDGLPMGAVAVSAEGVVRRVNEAAAEFFGEGGRNLEGHPIERTDSILADAAREVLASGQESEQRILTVRRKNLRVKAVPLHPDSTADGGVLLLLEPPPSEPEPEPESGDWDHAVLEETLRDMSRTLGHNFKNAMVPIKTCAELLPDRYAHEAFRQSFFAVVTESIGKIDSWITSIMQLGQLGTSRRDPTVLRLHDAIEDALDQAQQAFPSMKVRVIRDYTEGDRVLAEHDVLVKAFLECIRNAFDVLQDVPHPTLRLCTRVGSDGVEAFVEDNGVGIPADVKSAILKPFFTRKLTGLGLGLTFVVRALELFGGSVDILDGDEGGARVRIQLPLAAEVPVAAVQPA